jgi:hypothetical protein
LELHLILLLLLHLLQNFLVLVELHFLLLQKLHHLLQLLPKLQVHVYLILLDFLEKDLLGEYYLLHLQLHHLVFLEMVLNFLHLILLLFQYKLVH